MAFRYLEVEMEKQNFDFRCFWSQLETEILPLVILCIYNFKHIEYSSEATTFKFSIKEVFWNASWN